ncbi:uncharacterized protein LOC120768299 [Bactrocera tryoni]|uniref:uncharacterized protein LOC120768299 n=1 Tax=Bactrocera tryoni TaxID=59916 RepID=UPI001A97CF1B|nr:uncharacterized protein LOC120768299 [Bactrocera tryoni]
MNSSITKSKYDRATHEQLEQYVAFCQAHPEIGNRKNSTKSPEDIQQLWKQLAEELNSCRGPTRSVAKWKETLGVWKSQLRIRGKRLKMSPGLTSGEPTSKPMSDFEKKALSTFDLPAVNGAKGFGLMSHEPLTVDCSTTPTETASSSCSRLSSCTSPPPSFNQEQPASAEASIKPALSTCPSESLENQDAATTQLSRGDRKKLLDTLIANIVERNAVGEQKQRIESERQLEHREMMQAIQGLTNTVAEGERQRTESEKHREHREMMQAIKGLTNTIAEEERKRIACERRQEHQEIMQAIQGLTNTVAEFLNVLKQRLHNGSQ